MPKQTYICAHCQQPFTRYPSHIKTATPCCSRSCATNFDQPWTYEREKAQPNTTCSVCGAPMHRPPSHLSRTEAPTCSRQCNGALRGKELATHAHKGRAAWTEEGKQSYNKNMSGENNPAWKGGVTYRKRKGVYAQHSIKYVRCPQEYSSMARKDGYVMEHRLIMAQHLGRALTRVEVVHHVNHDPTDNRIENLRLFANNAEHKRHEGETGHFKDYYRPLHSHTTPHSSA